MKYILIKKKYGNDNANLSDILREYLESNYNIEPGENTIIIDDCKVQYSFSNNKDDNRCFFTLSSDERIYSNAKCLEHILEDIKRSGLLPYFHFLKVYDGLSEYYCKKLYPLYAAYERKVRYMILLMVTRSYGDKWIDNTIDDDTKTSISEKAEIQAKASMVFVGNINQSVETLQKTSSLFDPCLQYLLASKV